MLGLWLSDLQLASLAQSLLLAVECHSQDLVPLGLGLAQLEPSWGK